MELQLAYILLGLLMCIVIIRIGRHAVLKANNENPKKANSATIKIIIGLLLWHLYIFFLDQIGILRSYTLPPRFPLLTVAPLFIFTGIFIYKQRNKMWIKVIPAHWLIFYQSFRIVIESLFVFSVAAGVLHKNVTIEGYNYDMLFGCSAIPIAWLIMKNEQKYRKLAMIWNYFGLVVIAFIIFLFITSIFFPSMYGTDINKFPIEFTHYPYILVAAFLMPSAVFMHILSIVNLNQNK
ncbi:MAG: hypothetical protein HKN22_01405 [Bacteroidia bacterium]|nr:hypothetical protein [Bacteroidia bacterium]